MAISNKQKRILVVILAVIAAYMCVYTSNSRIFHTENYVHDESNLTERSNCWKTTTEKNKINSSYISPHTMLCLFEPISAMDYKRIDKKTVVIGVGVHLGPAAIGKHSIPYADIEYISWDYRDKNYHGNQQYLIHGFSNDHLLKTQKIFWDLYQGDKDLQRADIIVCGFDAWHCLIFAPFNKKLVIDSAYRFDGHIGIDRANQIELQKRLYEAVRYNPDVIIAGEIVYDVAYSQHFLGSHKIIPLPADGEYVLQRLKSELEEKSDMICRNVPINSTGYHPTIPFTITVGPKRLSGGGSKVADEIYQYFQKRPGKYKVDIMEKHMKQPYKYCDLGRYSAMIVLGYSVMSYFTLECSALGIPMFVPTPRLYAEWEKKYHLIPERKGPLQQTSFDYMKQNSRSLNFWYNPNDDYNMAYLERWVGYSDYYYYKGTILFDSYEELYEKIENAYLQKMNEEMAQHAKETGLKFRSHWKSINKYFHGNKDEDVVAASSSQIASTFDEGLKQWMSKVKRPNFEQDMKEISSNEKQPWVIIDFDLYVKDFKTMPDCNQIKDFKVIFFRQASGKAEFSNGCEIQSINHTITLLPEKFKELNFSTSTHTSVFIMMIYAVMNKATALVTLDKEGCDLDTSLIKIAHFSPSWKQKTFLVNQYFSAWLPFDSTLVKFWMKLVSKFIAASNLPPLCALKGSKSIRYNTDDLYALEDYLEHWITDETVNFFHILDQLNFELAVRGYVSKSNAILYRFWLEHLAKFAKLSIPEIQIDY